jgi:MFS family permease
LNASAGSSLPGDGRQARYPGSRALAPVAASFVVLGTFWGSWAVAAADVRRTFGFDDAQLGALLAVAVTVSGILGALVGNRAERWGSVRTLRWSLLVWAVLLVATGAARRSDEFAVAFVCAMAASGSVDMTMNAASAARLANRPGSLVRFHAIFNVGALVGAVAVGSLDRGGLSWRWAWPCAGVLAVVTAVWVARAGADPRHTGRRRAPAARATGTLGAGTLGAAALGPSDGRRGDHLSFAASLRVLHRDGLLVLLAVFAAAEVVEGGVDTWGVLYLRTHLAVGALAGASAYGLGQVVAIATRSGAGPGLGRLGPRVAVVVGATAAAGGLAVEATAGTAALAGAGLAVAAGGSAIFWPLLMAHASRAASRPTATVSTFTAAGYVGWVAGAPVIGALADRWGLGAGLAVTAGLAGVVAIVMATRPQP